MNDSWNPLASWRSGTHEEGADTDDAPEPERRDEDGDVPVTVADPGSGPFAHQDIYPLRHPDGAPERIIVELAAPVMIEPAREFSTGTVVIGEKPVQLVGRDADRLALVLTSRGTQVLYLAETAEALAGSGANVPTRSSIEADESRTIGHRAPIWAKTDTGTATIEYWIERR